MPTQKRYSTGEHLVLSCLAWGLLFGGALAALATWLVIDALAS